MPSVPEMQYLFEFNLLTTDLVNRVGIARKPRGDLRRWQAGCGTLAANGLARVLHFSRALSAPENCPARSGLLPFLHHTLVRVLVEDLAGTCRSKHAYWNSVLLQEVGYLPHSPDRLTRIVSEPTDRILGPVAR